MMAAGLSLVWFLNRRMLGALAACMGCGVVICGRWCPSAYAAFRKVGEWLGRAAGAALTWALLVPFFYVCFTAGRLALLALRKDPLCRKCPSDEPTYWVRREAVRSADRYGRQY